MLKNKSKIVVGFLIILLLISTTTVFASNEVSEANENDISLISADNETDTTPIADGNTSTPEENSNYKKSDVYLFGDTVSVDYIVDGNLFICANKVYINSQIGGDAFILAKEIEIGQNGYIYSNLFALTNSLDIKGIVYDLFTCAKTVSISGGYVYRDARVACDTLNVNGVVGRNALVNASSINFNTDSASNGLIYGDLKYSSKSELTIPDTVVIGETTFTQEENNSTVPTAGEIAMSLLSVLVLIVLVWLVCNWLAPKFVAYSNNYIGKRTLKTFGIGLLAMIAIPLVSVILITLKVTSLFALIILAIYLIALVVSYIVFIISVNQYLCERFKADNMIKKLGLLVALGIVVYLVTLIPYVGGIISILMTVFGLGVLTSYVLPNHCEKVQK